MHFYSYEQIHMLNALLMHLIKKKKSFSISSSLNIEIFNSLC